jgi:hypothetical protein
MAVNPDAELKEGTITVLQSSNLVDTKQRTLPQPVRTGPSLDAIRTPLLPPFVLACNCPVRVPCVSSYNVLLNPLAVEEEAKRVVPDNPPAQSTVFSPFHSSLSLSLSLSVAETFCRAICWVLRSA